MHLETFYGAIKTKTLNTKTGEYEEEIRYTKTVPVASMKESDVKNIVDDKIRKLFESKNFSEIKDKGISLPPNLKKNPKGTPTPIKKIKVYANKLSPSVLKPHTHISSKEYKRNYIIEKGGNYAITLYRGKDTNENMVNACKIISNLELSNQVRKGSINDLFPNEMIVQDGKKQQISIPHFCTLRPGNLVIMYNDSPNEIPFYQALANNETINIKELPENIIKETKLRIFKLIKTSIPNNLVFGRHFYSKIDADKDDSVKDVTKKDGKVIRCNCNTFKGIPIHLDITSTFIKKSIYKI